MDDKAKAFGEGCDARIAGRGRHMACPYRVEQERDLYLQWRRGWLDVHHHWASWPIPGFVPLRLLGILRPPINVPIRT